MSDFIVENALQAAVWPLIMDFLIENALQAAIWPILKQIAANRKLKNKSKRC